MKVNRFTQLAELLDNFSHSALLYEVVKGMSDSEFNEIYEHITRMWGLNEI